LKSKFSDNYKNSTIDLFANPAFLFQDNEDLSGKQVR